MKTVLQANNLTKIYRRIKNQVEGVENVSLNTKEGSITALLGQNGAGKSTFIKMIASVLEPDKGEIFIEGNKINNKKGVKYRKDIGYAPENPYFYTKLTGWEFARFIEEVYDYGINEGGELSFVALSEKLELKSHLDKLVSSYSQGMLRKLILCLAIAFGRKLIILDEPSNGLDPDSYLALREVLEKAKKDNRSILLSTHQLAMAQELADTIAICHKGHIYCFDNTSESVEELYIRITQK